MKNIAAFLLSLLLLTSSLWASGVILPAQDVDLASHTGELGATWTDHPHAAYDAGITVDSATDRIYSAGTAAYYASGIPPSANYRVCMDFYLHSAISQNLAVAGRMDTTADTMYLGRLNSGTSWQLRKIVATTPGDLGTDTDQLPSVGNFKTGCLIMAGDQISFTVNGVTEIGPITDTSITAAGRAGVRNSGAASASTGIHGDNFSAR